MPAQACNSGLKQFSLYALKAIYSLGCGTRCDSEELHLGSAAQVNVVCHKTRLLRILLKKERNVPLLVIWTNQRKALPPDEAVKCSQTQNCCPSLTACNVQRQSIWYLAFLSLASMSQTAGL